MASKPNLGNCKACGKSLLGKRVHAQYCNRVCKAKGAENRLRSGEGDGAKQPCLWCGAMSFRNCCSAPCRDRRRYVNEKDKRKAHAVKAYWEDPEYSRTYAANHRHQGRERRVQWAATRREREAFERIPITHKEWERLKARHHHCCAYCGTRPDLLEMDHVVPLSRGGRHRPGNILPACVTCNRSKRAMFLSEWRYKHRSEVTPSL